MAAFPTSVNSLSAAPAGLQGHASVATQPVTCGTCGCRLEQSAAGDGHTVWRHFSGASGRDARGCLVACAAADHDARGVAV